MWFNLRTLPNLDFDNRSVATTNFQGIFGIYMTHKSLLSAGASDLYTWHILSLHFKFLLCANLMTNLEFPNEFATIAYEFLYLNITIAMWMHLWDVQIRRCLLWMSDSIARPCKSVYNWNVCIHHVRNIRNSFSCSAVSKPHSHNVILIYVIPPF
jgi:hypothetical protein